MPNGPNGTLKCTRGSGTMPNQAWRLLGNQGEKPAKTRGGLDALCQGVSGLGGGRSGKGKKGKKEKKDKARGTRIDLSGRLSYNNQIKR